MQQYYDLLGLDVNCSKEKAKEAFLIKKKSLQTRILSRDAEERAEAVKALGELTGAYKAIMENIGEHSMRSSASVTKNQDDTTPAYNKKKEINTDSKCNYGTNENIKAKISQQYIKNNTNTNMNNNMMITIFSILVCVFLLSGAVYFVLLKPNNDISMLKSQSLAQINNNDTSIISKTEMDKEKYNADITNLANMINEALSKKGTLKNENKLHDDAIKIEGKILESIVVLRNSNENSSEKGKALLVLLEAERKRVRGLSDGLQAAINGFDYQPGFKAGSDAYYEYEKLNNNYINKKANVVEKQIGYTNGDDVFLRESPSTTSRIVQTLKRNVRVDVIGIEQCNDLQAAMVDTDNIVVGYNGNNIKLHRGQPITITGENTTTYQCRLDLEASSGDIYLNKRDVKKLYGNIWYNVKTSMGQTGWIYKDFITLK